MSEDKLQGLDGFIEELEEEEDDDLAEESSEGSSGDGDTNVESVQGDVATANLHQPTPSGAIPFVHLHTHSHYSLLDGIGKLDALIARAKELEMPALALTDHGNMYGALEFYQKALDAGIKPIIGYEAYVAPGSRFEKSDKKMYHLTLLAMNEQGYKNLLKLSSIAFLEGFYYKPRIDRELLRKYHEGLVCLSGCLSGEVARILKEGRGSAESYEKAKSVALWYKELFGDRYYMELQNHGLYDQQIPLEKELQLAKELGIPTVTTCFTKTGKRKTWRCASTRVSSARTRVECAWIRRNSISRAVKRCSTRFLKTPTRCGAPLKSRIAANSTLNLANAFSRSSRPPTASLPTNNFANSASKGLRGVTRTIRSALSTGSSPKRSWRV